MSERIADKAYQPAVFAQADAQFRALVEAAPDAILIVDKRGLIVLVNGQTERLFDYNRAELLGQPIEVLVPHRYRYQHQSYINNYFTHPHTRPMGKGLDLYGLRNDGSEFPIEISLSPLQMPDGVFTISTIRDVTDRKEAEHARQFNRERRSIRQLKQLSEAALIMNSTHSFDELLHFINEQARLIIGAHYAMTHLTEANEHVSSRTATSCSPHYVQWKDTVAQLIERLEIASMVSNAHSSLRLRRSDIQMQAAWHDLGNIRPFISGLLATPLTTRSNTYLGMICLTNKIDGDFTEQDEALLFQLAQLASVAMENARLLAAERAAHERAVQHASRYEAILLAMADGILIFDAEQQITFANPLAKSMFRLDPKLPVNGQSFVERGQRFRPRDERGHLLPPDQWAVMRAFGGEVVTGSATVDTAIERPNGNEIVCNVSAAPIYDEEKRISGVVATFHDVTERRKLDQMKDDFINTASHELRTPLTVLHLNAQMMHRKVKDSDEFAEIEQFIADILSSTKRIDHLITTMLDMARITGDNFAITIQPCDLAQLVREVAEEHRLLTNHAIELQGSRNAIIGTVDIERVRQVVTNLLSNAIRYSPQTSTIMVTIEMVMREGRPWFDLTVSDQGEGIASEHLSHLFERFYRVQTPEHAALTPNAYGLGLGLFLAKSIIEAHHGLIEVVSELGAGSSFCVKIPLAQEDEAKES